MFSEYSFAIDSAYAASSVPGVSEFSMIASFLTFLPLKPLTTTCDSVYSESVSRPTYGVNVSCTSLILSELLTLIIFSKILFTFSAFTCIGVAINAWRVSIFCCSIISCLCCSSSCNFWICNSTFCFSPTIQSFIFGVLFLCDVMQCLYVSS